VWSGVREKRFRLVPEDFFVTEECPSRVCLTLCCRSPLPALRTLMTRTTLIRSLGNSPHFTIKIYRTVTDSIKADPRAQAIYDAATEFTLLQRFFRLGFEGFLGDEFPVEKFV